MTVEKRTTSTLQVFLLVCFVAYLLLLLKVIVFKHPTAMMTAILEGWSLEALGRHLKQANFVPFKTILSGFSNNALPTELKTLFYNIVAFSPMGFLLPWLTPRLRNWRWVLGIGLLISLAFECIQLVTILGEADIDDIILNGLGVLLGYACFLLGRTLYDRLRVMAPDPAAR